MHNGEICDLSICWCWKFQRAHCRLVCQCTILSSVRRVEKGESFALGRIRCTVGQQPISRPDPVQDLGAAAANPEWP